MRGVKSAAGLLGSLVLGVILGVGVLVGGGEADAASPTGGVLKVGPGGVPGRYAGLVEKGGRCPRGQSLPAGLLAAQLRQESGFDPRAESDKGARGIAQFMPGTWASRGIDGDGDGDRDIWDPKDAIPSQGRMMCDLLAQARRHPEYNGNPAELALAGYNAGWGAVQEHEGVPPYRETQRYVDAIMAGVDDLTTTEPPGTGRWSRPVSAPLGTPYHASGSSWASGQHTGIDFTAATGSRVKAVGPGTVTAAGPGGAYGTQIILRHGDGMYSQYAHLSAVHVHTGQTVRGGQTIGRSGSSGNASGPHLHLEIRTTPAYGADIDPIAYLRKHGVTVGEQS